MTVGRREFVTCSAAMLALNASSPTAASDTPLSKDDAIAIAIAFSGSSKARLGMATYLHADDLKRSDESNWQQYLIEYGGIRDSDTIEEVRQYFAEMKSNRRSFWAIQFTPTDIPPDPESGSHFSLVAVYDDRSAEWLSLRTP